MAERLSFCIKIGDNGTQIYTEKSPQGDLNPRPSDLSIEKSIYESDAPPLSYGGL